jgi:hypothetical protein
MRRSSNRAGTKTNHSFQEGYIEVEKVPDAVKKSARNSPSGSSSGKAYINAKKEYKLEITVKDQKLLFMRMLLETG